MHPFFARIQRTYFPKNTSYFEKKGFNYVVPFVCLCVLGAQEEYIQYLEKQRGPRETWKGQINE